MNSEVEDVNMKSEQNEESGREDDETHKKSLELQEQSLGPLKEDLADWIAKTLGKVPLVDMLRYLVPVYYCLSVIMCCTVLQLKIAFECEIVVQRIYFSDTIF